MATVPGSGNCLPYWLQLKKFNNNLKILSINFLDSELLVNGQCLIWSIYLLWLWWLLWCRAHLYLDGNTSDNIPVVLTWPDDGAMTKHAEAAHSVLIDDYDDIWNLDDDDHDTRYSNQIRWNCDLYRDIWNIFQIHANPPRPPCAADECFVRCSHLMWATDSGDSLHNLCTGLWMATKHMLALVHLQLQIHNCHSHQLWGHFVMFQW